MTGDFHMLFGTLDHPVTYQSLLNHPTWKKAIDWLNEHHVQLPDDGEYELDGHDLRAIVQTVNLQHRSERIFEGHRREIDLHCCFSGSEIIERAPVEALKARTEYDAEKDFTLYDVPSAATEIRMVPGVFAIFFPQTGHMPGIKSEHDQTRKVVIKINTDLLKGKAVILGPFEATVNYKQSEEVAFNALVTNGRFDRVNSTDINPRNFPFSPIRRERITKGVLLVNLGRPVANEQAPEELKHLGYKPVKSEWILALNARHPTLMDDHIIITTNTPWKGREDVPEVICLHNDDGKRSLRTYYADTVWGPHIWFAVERLV